MTAVGEVRLWAPDGVGEVSAGTDLVALLGEALPGLLDGDVVIVTSKVVSKSEGRTSTGTREDALAGETVRVVARRGSTSIVANHLGLVMAAAGIDASNVAPGTVVLLPDDPDATARTIREGLLATTGRNVAVLVTDTAGRAWRHGQTDLAIGVAGLPVLDDHAGRVDRYGNPLAVTAPAIADEVAAASDLVRGKLTARPFAVVRGLGARVLAAGDHGPGARSLVRPVAEDMFALGTREAVLAALTGSAPDAFGAPASADELVAGLSGIAVSATIEGATVDGATVEGTAVRLGSGIGPVDQARAAALAHAFGWSAADARIPGLLRSGRPAPAP